MKNIKLKLNKILLGKILIIILTLFCIFLRINKGHTSSIDMEKIQVSSPITIQGSLDINLMWLCKQKTKDSFVFPDPKQNEILTVLHGWAQKNNTSSTTVTFWYDSHKASPLQVHQTQDLFKCFYVYQCLVQLRDIRTLQKVFGHPALFDDTVPIYFQTDFIRFLMAQESLREKETYLYADLNVTPEGPAYLFDDTTVHYLNTYGIVMLRNDLGENSHPDGGSRGFENKFMMLRYNADLDDVMNDYLIAPFVRFIEDPQYKIKRPRITEAVYSIIPELFKFLFWKKGLIEFYRPDTSDRFSVYEKPLDQLIETLFHLKCHVNIQHKIQFKLDELKNRLHEDDVFSDHMDILKKLRNSILEKTIALSHQKNFMKNNYKLRKLGEQMGILNNKIYHLCLNKDNMKKILEEGVFHEDIQALSYNLKELIETIESIPVSRFTPFHEAIDHQIALVKNLSRNPYTIYAKLPELRKQINRINFYSLIKYERHRDKIKYRIKYSHMGKMIESDDDQLVISDSSHRSYDTSGLTWLTKHYYKPDFRPENFSVSWPLHLPIPTKRMTAPRSHFG